ncbi:uncharacterized protein LOC111247893 isoform X2 [Varroa destructor]|uniref:Uncharacterized protein n=1 Tax=Varroa destructor TaxID=109461 RepID=A0A7M7JP79_VARDE|nr:uncharacterized protein LOC111247893 isoform X2 [Varroa destructor]
MVWSTNSYDLKMSKQKAAFGTSSDSCCCPPLSQTKEVRTEVTPDLLAKILKSTAKAKHINLTQELALKGKAADACAKCSFITATNIRKLKSSCPSMKTLQLQNLNLRAKQKSRRVRLADFPANIERVSVRGSMFEPKSFFSKMTDESSKSAALHKLSKLRVLDVGRAVFLEGNTGSDNSIFPPERSWPAIDSLEELYLEGAPHLKSAKFLETLLRNYPNLKVLDLEGTEISEGDLVTIARHAPDLRELYVGYTSLKDSSIIALENSRTSGSAGSCLDKLEVICLCETNVSELGLASFVRTCQSLRRITVKRSKVSEEAANRAMKVLPGLIVHRVENIHIYAVFRNQGCAHFSLKHDLAVTPSVTTPVAASTTTSIVAH